VVVLALGGALPLRAQVFDKPLPTSPPVTPRAGPAWVKAVATVPTLITLQWAPVTAAAWYHILRSSSANPAEVLIQENASEQDLQNGYFFFFDFLPDRSGSVTFSYRVVAVFVGTDASQTLSISSPTATATALQPQAPPNFKFRLFLSPIMGRWRVVLNWNSVPGATGYHVWQTPKAGQPQLPLREGITQQTTLTIEGVVPGQGGLICLSTLYDSVPDPDDTVRSCVWVATPPQ
jgi:hypothetical protein